MKRIDSHHHLWKYEPTEYEWIDSSMEALRRDYLLDELSDELRGASVDGTIVVQARQSILETEWLLSLAERTAWIYGVVGWLPIASPRFPELLSGYTACPRLKGLRHVVQAEPSGFLEADDFNRGLATITEFGYVFDLLVTARQLSEAIACVDRHPRQMFVLDHLGKPEIRRGELASWAASIRGLAQRPNVFAKLSGLITEADPLHWSSQILFPYLDVALDSFGPQRLMIGTDWPVLSLGCSYRQWWQLIEGWASKLSSFEQQCLLGGTAARVYNIT